MTEVLIDGKRYVPAVDWVAGSQLDGLLQALYESYMAAGEHWSAPGAYKVWLSINEDGEGLSFEEITTLVAGITARGNDD